MHHVVCHFGNARIPLPAGPKTDVGVQALETNAGTEGIGELFYGNSLKTMFNTPGIPPADDPRTPDIVVAPNYGVVYTGSSSKQSEHGGFSHDDTNVVLLLSNPRLKPAQVNSPVETTQVAPTILNALRLNPNRLDAVRIEGTPALPGVRF